MVGGGIWNGSSCDFPQYVKKSGDQMTGNLIAPKFEGDIDGHTAKFTTSSATKFCTGTNCKGINELALANKVCGNGQVQIGVKDDGTPNCKALQCGDNLFFAGLDNNNNPVCRPYPTKTCPTNQYVASVNRDGTVNCAILPNNAKSVCPDGTVIQSINAGIPSCVNKGANTTCALGKVVTAVAADGSVTCSDPIAMGCLEGSTLIYSSGRWVCGCPDDRAWDRTTRSCKILKEGKYNATRDYNGCYGNDFTIDIVKQVSALKNKYIYNITVSQTADYSTVTKTAEIKSGEQVVFNHANGRDSQSMSVYAYPGIDDRVLIRSNNCKGSALYDRYTISNADFN